MRKETSLYKLLTPKELAVLAFKYCADHDAAEAERVCASVPRSTYITTDMQYRVHLENISTVVLLWGMEYWKRCTAYGIGSHLPSITGKSSDNIRTAVELWSHVQDHIQVMKRICRKIGLPMETVQQITGAIVDWSLPNQAYHPDTEKIEREYQDIMRIFSSS